MPKRRRHSDDATMAEHPNDNRPTTRRMPASPLPHRAALLAIAVLPMAGCSTSQLVARGASPLIEQGVVAMNRETDLELARASIPANLKMVEALLLADPGNAAYRVQAAMGFYAYALGFVEPG